MKFLLSVLFAWASLFANENLHSIYENILLKDVSTAQNVAKVLEKNIQDKDLAKTKESFTSLVYAWKSIEAFYVLGDLNEDYLDTPRYMDIFHQGNEDIKVQLKRIVLDTEELSISLYKNSHKTINALEYILCKEDLENPRVQKIALIIIHSLQSYLSEMEQGYIDARESFVSDEQKANAVMLNALIENSYKIKEWRVGDPAGLSRKYKNKADNTQAEYALSANSFVAIQAILETHLRILDTQSYANFGSLLHSYEVKAELVDAISYLHRSLQELKSLEKEDFAKAKPLYKSLKKLHMTYYISLIGKLKITAKILDADGD